MKNSPNSLVVPVGGAPAGASVTALVYAAATPAVGATLILAHGAGAGQQSAFMTDFARALSSLGVDVVTFNFPYIEQRRRIPDRAPVLEACFRAAIDRVRAAVPSAREALFIGGKSMGGRIATQVAAADPDLPIAGLVLLGYPLHPPGKPEQRRDKHLPDIRRPMMFVHGTRDAFGTPAELGASLDGLHPAPSLHLVEGGDHSFKLARKDATSQKAVYASVQQMVVSWIAPLRRRRA